MIFFPAIDLKNGNCVRLLYGDMEKETIFNEKPELEAMRFEQMGAKWLHVVDLNGAFKGEVVNKDAIMNIINNTNLKIQLGGGIRTLNDIEKWVSLGVERVILGTVAITNPTIIKQACEKFPGKIVVGLDARGNDIAIEGWAQSSGVDIIEKAKEFENMGVSAIVYTDINRDGALSGINVESTANLAANVNIPVIASGGLQSINDVIEIKKYNNIQGVISGRAIYDGRIDVIDALEICGGE